MLPRLLPALGRRGGPPSRSVGKLDPQMQVWTDIYNDYCQIADEILDAELAVLGCSEEMLLSHAVLAQGDPRADEVLDRLLAKTDYMRFCEMMHAW